MKIRTLSQIEVDAFPNSAWNAFVDLLAVEDYAELTSGQRAAHLVFWYEKEVQNGGHLQYFVNRGTQRLSETISSLGLLSAVCQKRILQDASELWQSRSRNQIESVEEYCDIALANEFGTFDQRFSQCSPDLLKVLEAYFDQHRSLFVAIK